MFIIFIYGLNGLVATLFLLVPAVAPVTSSCTISAYTVSGPQHVNAIYIASSLYSVLYNLYG
jgi:hypothetical protein